MRPLLYALAIVSSQFFLLLIMKLLLYNAGIPSQGEDELAEDHSGSHILQYSAIFLRLFWVPVPTDGTSKSSVSSVSSESSESKILPIGETRLLTGDLNIVGLVLARGGSKGIKRKNLMKIGNTTLLGRSLKAIHQFGRFSSVWVSTDSAEIAEEAKAHGAMIHWRSKESATDTAPSILGVQDFVTHHTGIQIVVLIQCTSPFLTATFLSEGFDLMLRGDYDSLFSVTRRFDLRWEENPDDTVKPLNFHPENRPRRQDWGGELVENGMFYFVKTEFVHFGRLQGGRTGVVEIPANHSLQVDTFFDLQKARALFDAQLLL